MITANDSDGVLGTQRKAVVAKMLDFFKYSAASLRECLKFY